MSSIKAINWNNVSDFDNIIWKQNNRNIWFPEEIPITDDKLCWKSMNKTEQDTYKKVLGGLTLLDTQQSLVGMPKIMLNCNDLYQKSIMNFMGMMETVHAKSYSSIFTTLCTSEEINDIFDWTDTNIYLVEKMRIILDVYDNIDKYSIEVAMAVSVMLESFLFYSGFFYPLYLAGHGKLTSSNEIINLIIRDECCLEGTEILTPTGWELIENIHQRQKVAQYNEDSTIEFVYPIKISNHVNDTAYELKTFQGHIHQIVSPNHRFVIENKGKLRIIQAKDVEKRHFNFGNNIINAGKKKDGTIDKLSMKDRLLIAIQADGNFDRTKNLDGDYRRSGKKTGFIPINFGLKKERKIERLLFISNELNLKVVDSSYKNRDIKKFTVYIPCDYPVDKLLSSIAPDVENITSNYAKEFIEEVMNWDGHIRKDTKGFYYSSSVKENSEFIQMMCVLCGYKSLVTKTSDNRKESYKDSYRVHINNKTNKSGLQRAKLNKLSGSFTFYGIEVPSGNIVTKFNKTTNVTGNSIHSVYIGQLFQKENKNDKNKIINDIFNRLFEIELNYTEYLYKDLNLVNDVQNFIKYNSNKAFMNLGLDIPFPYSKDSDINSLVIKGLSTETKTHNFFDSKGNGYIKANNIEKISDDDFNF